MNDSKLTECGAGRSGSPTRCNRTAGHSGDHGYGGVFWPRDDAHAPPLWPADMPTFCELGVLDGKFYAAPVGTPPDLYAIGMWVPVESLADVAELLGVQL